MLSVKTINQVVLLVVLTVMSSVSLSAKRTIESGDNSPGFSYIADSGAVEPIIRYQLNIEMLASISDRQTVSIFGDGRVVVHNPAYMKKAGDYQMQLSENELNDLVLKLSDDGVMDFDHKQVKKRVQATRKSMRDKGRFYEISDAVETVVEINLDEYQKNRQTKKIIGFKKQFRWKNLQQDAQRYSDVSLMRANDAVDRLLKIQNDSRLARAKR